MEERLSHALIELVCWVVGRAPVTPLQARQHARVIAGRDRLDANETRRLVRVADALVAPLPVEDE